MTSMSYWTIINELYNRDGVIVSKVVPIIYDNLDINNKEELKNTKWVMKKSKKRWHKDELDIIKSLKIYNNDLSIKFPNDHRYFSNTNEKESWYIMECYDNSINKEVEFTKMNINNFIIDIINFLEWLHIKKNKIYGDLKMQNIVVQKDKKMFRIIDFESIQDNDFKVCCNYLPEGYYYYGLGCDYNKPFYSFRMDLQAFGYILWHILFSNNILNFNWQLKAFDCYNRYKSKYTFRELEKYKSVEIIPDIIKKYFKIIEDIDWYDSKSKPNVYIDIKKLFVTTS